ncbi:PACE efflux transporter [Pseudooceanicola sp.]|uniref:PACE efflux transporter n=1 Tax=Pseudooceanicola sp. TaxID=1914328 RepID=UPI004059F7FF
MRTTSDRIRQALAFEVIALIIVGPLGGWVFGHGTMDFGLVALISSVVASGWAFLYNLGFDHALMRWRGRADKGLALRILHAVLLEAGLIVLLVPVVAWTLEIGLVEAFWIDISLSGFFLVYAFVFYWLYDRIFPVPAPAAGGPAT